MFRIYEKYRTDSDEDCKRLQFLEAPIESKKYLGLHWLTCGCLTLVEIAAQDKVSANCVTLRCCCRP